MMKNQTTNLNEPNAEKSPIPAALTRALRAAIQSNKVEGILVSAGATKFRGVPVEVLEEVAAAQTAAWIIGVQGGPMATPAPTVETPAIFETAAQTIDHDGLTAAAGLVGVHATAEVQKIRTFLAANLACTALEATRFANAEGRPVDHSCVAIGGTHVASGAPFAEPSPASAPAPRFSSIR